MLNSNIYNFFFRKPTVTGSFRFRQTRNIINRQPWEIPDFTSFEKKGWTDQEVFDLIKHLPFINKMDLIIYMFYQYKSMLHLWNIDVKPYLGPEQDRLTVQESINDFILDRKSYLFLGNRIRIRITQGYSEFDYLEQLCSVLIKEKLIFKE